MYIVYIDYRHAKYADVQILRYFGPFYSEKSAFDWLVGTGEEYDHFEGCYRWGSGVRKLEPVAPQDRS